MVQRIRIRICHRGVVHTGDDHIDRADPHPAVAVLDGIIETVGMEFTQGQTLQEGRRRCIIQDVVFLRVGPQDQCHFGVHVGHGIVTNRIVQNNPNALLRVIINKEYRNRKGVGIQHGDGVVSIIGGMSAVVGDQNFGAGSQTMVG